MASKKEQALALYKTMSDAAADGAVVRKTFIERCVAELGMTPAGASTYYSNSKTAATGGTVKSYYTSTVEKAVTQAVDDTKQDAPVWSVVVIDDEKVDAVHAFMNPVAATTRWNSLKPATQARCVVVVGAPKEGTPVTNLTLLDTAES